MRRSNVAPASPISRPRVPPQRSGRLSAEQASAIADAVAVNPDAANDLLGAAAQLSVGELRLRCAKAKAEKQDLEQIERQIHTRRRLRRWRDAEGAEHMHATGTKREMALVDQAAEARHR